MGPPAVHGRPVLVPGAPEPVRALDRTRNDERVPDLQSANAGGEELLPEGGAKSGGGPLEVLVRVCRSRREGHRLRIADG